MKRIILMLTIIGAALTLQSCYTQQFVVKGAPGTEIYSPSGELKTVIDDSGEGQVKLSRNKEVRRNEGDYSCFYTAKAPGSNIQVPFALDYKDNKSRDLIWPAFLGLATYGLTGGLLGLIMNVAGEEAAGTTTYLIGTGLLGSSFVTSWATTGTLINGPQELYDYQKEQTTNNDLIK